jgi:hypothetical protein
MIGGGAAHPSESQEDDVVFWRHCCYQG